jgi:hypothetical protein
MDEWFLGMPRAGVAEGPAAEDHSHHYFMLWDRDGTLEHIHQASPSVAEHQGRSKGGFAEGFDGQVAVLPGGRERLDLRRSQETLRLRRYSGFHVVTQASLIECATAGAACLQRGVAREDIHTAVGGLILERQRILAIYRHVGLAEGPAKNTQKLTGDRKK